MAIAVQRLAVEANVFPLWQYDNRTGRLEFTHPVDHPIPVERYLSTMGRFRHLNSDEIAISSEPPTRGSRSSGPSRAPVIRGRTRSRRPTRANGCGLREEEFDSRARRLSGGVDGNERLAHPPAGLAADECVHQSAENRGQQGRKYARRKPRCPDELEPQSEDIRQKRSLGEKEIQIGDFVLHHQT